MTKKLSQTRGLKKLGAKTAYVYDGADKKLLERFPNPMTKGPGVGGVKITAPEFTSLCPMTGQPDFATIAITYVPREWCVESKALKMYLGSFRNFGEFHESCIRRIANDLIELLDPYTLNITGEFTPRGGIPFWPTVQYERADINFDFLDPPRVLEDKNMFFVGDAIYDKIEKLSNDQCRLTCGKETIGSARIAEVEVGEFDDMARKFATTNFRVKDRKRLEQFLEDTLGYGVEKDDIVTVVWFKDVVFFNKDQDLGDASGIVALHKDD